MSLYELWYAEHVVSPLQTGINFGSKHLVRRRTPSQLWRKKQWMVYREIMAVSEDNRKHSNALEQNVELVNVKQS